MNTTARIESFTVGGQIIVSPMLIEGARVGLVLGDDVEVHAKGMKEPLRCRQLRGHEERPELALGQEPACAPLADPLPVQYVLLTGKQLEEQMEIASFIALSHREAVIEARRPLPIFSNILLRLEAETGEEELPELYAKVLRPSEDSGNRYVIHFTSVPPGVRGEVSALPSELNQDSDRDEVRVLEVKFPDGRRVVIPRTNIEVIEGA